MTVLVTQKLSSAATEFEEGHAGCSFEGFSP